jgi:dihydrofolate reductase
MGRKTWDSLPAPPLPGRANIVLSRCQDLRGRGAYLARDVDEVLESLRCLSDGRASVIGGAEVFAAFLPFCRKIHLTLLDGEFPGDTFFPGGVPGPPDWHVTDPQWHEADEENPLGMTFQTLVREPARRSLDE